MKHDIADFIHAITHSTVLNREQKHELLDHPEALPELYRMELTIILRKYEERARMREDEVRKRIQEATVRFIRDLDAHNIADNVKNDLLEKSRQHVASLVRQAATS